MTGTAAIGGGCASADHLHRKDCDLSSMSGILADPAYRLLLA